MMASLLRLSHENFFSRILGSIVDEETKTKDETSVLDVFKCLLDQQIILQFVVSKQHLLS